MPWASSVAVAGAVLREEPRPRPLFSDPFDVLSWPGGYAASFMIRHAARFGFGDADWARALAAGKPEGAALRLVAEYARRAGEDPARTVLVLAHASVEHSGKDPDGSLRDLAEIEASASARPARARLLGWLRGPVPAQRRFEAGLRPARLR